jgi:tripartite-type tricarboxylate transporter receptor subunit TctC
MPVRYARRAILWTLLALTGFAQADETYPSRPVKVVANMAAGGGTDSIARMFAQRITSELGQPVIVENRAGAAGQIGTEVVAASAADGYTFLFASSSLLSLPYLRQTRYELLKDFEPVGQVGIGGFVLVVNPKLPFNTLSEFMAAVKAQPGKYTFGSPGVGSAGHLGLHLLRSKAGVDMVHVPFKSSSEVAQALISGQIDCAVDIVPIQKPYIEAKTVRAIATTGSTRDPSLPHLPTFNEAKVVDGGYELTFWYGMFAPRATPATALRKAQSAFSAVMADPGMRERIKTFGVAPSALDAAQFKASLTSEVALWRKIIKDNDIRID